MKKLLLFASLIILTLSVRSQTYYPLLDSTNDWRFSYNMVGVRLANPSTQIFSCGSYPAWTERLVTLNDSVVNSINYKTLVDPNANCVAGFLREDTAARKIYYRLSPSDSEYVLYDFSLNIGDTITRNFIIPNGYWTSGIFTVDSIVPYHIKTGWRRLFYLNNHLLGGNTLSWLESVGNQGELNYLAGNNSMGMFLYNSLPYFPHDYDKILTCFDHAYMNYYDSIAQYYASHNGNCIGYSDSCTYGNICGSVNENSAVHQIDAYPNPTSGKITMKMDMNKKVELSITIFDLFGRTVIEPSRSGMLYPGTTDLQLDLSGLPPGSYMVEFRSVEGAYYKQIAVIR